MTIGVDGTKGLDSDRAVPSMFFRQRQARTLPNGVIETMERAAKRMDRSERGLLLSSLCSCSRVETLRLPRR